MVPKIKVCHNFIFSYICDAKEHVIAMFGYVLAHTHIWGLPRILLLLIDELVISAYKRSKSIFQYFPESVYVSNCFQKVVYTRDPSQHISISHKMFISTIDNLFLNVSPRMYTTTFHDTVSHVLEILFFSNLE